MTNSDENKFFITRRQVRLLGIERGRGPSAVYGYGIATVALWAGVKAATAMRAMNRGLFSLGDLRSVAAYVLRKDKRRRGQGKTVARESGREIRERLAMGSKVETLP